MMTTIQTIDNNTTLDNFIKTFVSKDKRERSELELNNEKKRSKFADRLNHTWDTVLDMKFVTQIPSGVNDYEFIKKELKINDNESYYVIYNHDDIDGETDEFNKAFDKCMEEDLVY